VEQLHRDALRGLHVATLRPPSVTPVVDRRELVGVFTCSVWKAGRYW
jgi:hypothetical protein